MHLDVRQLHRFYYRSHLGRAVQSTVRGAVLDIWPEAKGQTVAGFGFAVPFLRPYLADARRVIALMPGPQGGIHWPPDGPNIAVICEETLWPIETGHVDKLMIMHGLENSDSPVAVLREAHRVLGPGGSVLFIVANRAGLWCRSDRTPFGFGRPYSASQLDTLLRDNGFVSETHRSVLFQPPSERRFWRRMAPLCERLGSRIPIGAGGLLMVRARKHGQAGQGTGSRIPLRRLKAAENPALAFGGGKARVPTDPAA